MDERELMLIDLSNSFEISFRPHSRFSDIADFYRARWIRNESWSARCINERFQPTAYQRERADAQKKKID